MKKILLMGLAPATTEVGLASWLTNFGPVLSLTFVRDGNADAPYAVAEMDVSDSHAFHIVSRICGYWHDGSLVSARLLVH